MISDAPRVASLHSVTLRAEPISLVAILFNLVVLMPLMVDVASVFNATLPCSSLQWACLVAFSVFVLNVLGFFDDLFDLLHFHLLLDRRGHL